MPERLWLYGVVPGDAPTPVQVGIDPNHRVWLVRDETLAAIVSGVEYDERTLHDALDDMETLERLARAHEHVLDTALTHGPVVPFRIGAICTSEQRVREILAQARPEFAQALQRLRGQAEWGVKVYALHQTAEPDLAPPPASGKDYLLRRRAERAVVKRTRKDLERELQAIHGRLIDHSSDVQVSPPRVGPLTRADADMVLNAAYLVADAKADRFGETAAQLARDVRDHGLQLELTGPWPAYHFALEP